MLQPDPFYGTDPIVFLAVLTAWFFILAALVYLSILLANLIRYTFKLLTRQHNRAHPNLPKSWREL